MKAISAPTPQAPSRQAHESLRQLLTEVFLDDNPVQRLMPLTEYVPPARRVAWHLVVHTLLARRLDASSPATARRVADAHTLAWTLQRQWEQPTLAQRWERLVSGWSARQCRQLVARARRQSRLH